MPITEPWRGPLLLLSLIFFTLAVTNIFVAVQVTNHPAITGQQFLGEVQFCVKRYATLSINSTFNTFEGQPIFIQVNFTNPDSSTLSFSDDAHFFIIDPGTALINFTPSWNSTGTHLVIITLTESNGPCAGKNLILSGLVNFLNHGFTNLSLWDETDPKGGNHTRHRVDRTLFFANYSASNSSVIRTADAFCGFRINISGVNYSETIPMVYNSTYGLWVANVTTNVDGNFTWQVFCNTTTSRLQIRNATDNVSISNTAPILIANYPNLTWNANTVLFGPSLLDYFYDPDGDTINFTASGVSNINITIDPLTAVVRFTPALNFYGNRTVIFTANDGYGGTAGTDIVYLRVLYVAPTESSGSSSGGGGGGGGGASFSATCSENWECSAFGPCLTSGIRERSCSDLAECETDYTRPNSSIPCAYNPTCFDGLRNQNESGVDCGGPCKACPTCVDGIQNQGELGLDCGGPCSACSSCYDNIQNQGELGLDCGGPCAACTSCSDGIQNQGESGVDCGGPCSVSCPTEEQPTVGGFPGLSIIAILLFLALAALIIGTTGYKYAWPHLVSLLNKKILIEKISLSEIIEQTESELRVLRRRSEHLEPKETIDEAGNITKIFFYHIFALESPFSFVQMATEVTKKKFSTKLMKDLNSYAKTMTELGYREHILKEAAMGVLDNSEKLVKACSIAVADEVAAQNMIIIEALMKKIDHDLKEGRAPSAKHAYQRIKNLYSILREDQKGALHQRLMDMHSRIQSDLFKNKKH